MRAAHSLKGAARIVGLDAAVRVAHAMEDAFVAAQKGQVVLRPEHVDILLRGVNFLVQIAQLGEAELPAWQSDHAAEVNALAADLAAVKEGRVEAKPPSPPVEPARVEPPAAEAPTPTPATAAPLPTPPTEPADHDHDRDREKDRVVRVTAESLTRLMGLAGEALVQSHRLRPMVNALWRLRERQSRLMETLQVLEDRLPGTGSSRGIAGSAAAPSLSAAGRELLAKARGRAAEGLQALSETVEALESFAHHSEDLSSRLHHEVLASRMRPLADGIRGFSRLVRDLARELGKEARFEVAGETTGVNRDILDRLEAPLNHLIRNALDHGIETPDERRSAGKPAAGTIRLEARHRAGMLQLVLTDDGRGVDLERLRAKVVERGLADPAMARRLGEAELLDFLFLPGFSTKQEVTAVSGRGVGLDVVHSMVHSVRGTVRVASRPGQGMRFILQLPITVSVIRALLVEIAGEPYAFPLSRIDRILMVDPGDVRDLEGKPHVLLDDQLVGLVEATSVLELDPAAEGGHGAGRRAATPCRWSSPATAAIASAWWSTASWASVTSASRRWTHGWARCPISAAPRCWRTAGPS